MRNLVKFLANITVYVYENNITKKISYLFIEKQIREAINCGNLLHDELEKYILGRERNPGGNLIRRISISKDYNDVLIALNGGALIKFKEAVKGIQISPSKDLSIQITHPKYLPFELFTDYGAGTYISN